MPVRAGRSGRAGVGLAVGLVALVAFLLLLWSSAGGRGSERGRGGSAPQLPVPVPGPADGLEAAPAPSRGVEAERVPPPAKARLVVVALPPKGVAPGSLRLDLEAADGRMRTETLEPGQREASLELEPGAHTLRLLDAGPPVLMSLPQRVELRAGATRTVELRLFACWSCTGSVVDEGERGVEGLPLSLERAGLPLEGARTDALGRFTFPPLPEGELELVVGDPRGPLVPRQPVRLDAELRALEIRVPMLLELTLHVVDVNGFPVANAEVDGTGERGGRFEGVTDVDGALRARHLPAGNYRVFARRADVGRGTRSFLLAPGAAEIEVPLLTAPER